MNFADNDLLMCYQVKIPDVLLPADVLPPPGRVSVLHKSSSFIRRQPSCRPTCIYAAVFAFLPQLLLSDG